MASSMQGDGWAGPPPMNMAAFQALQRAKASLGKFDVRDALRFGCALHLRVVSLARIAKLLGKRFAIAAG